jgi:hypothetical protein
MVEKFGSREAVSQFYRETGRVGGSVKNPKKGFGSNRELASRMGRVKTGRKRIVLNEEQVKTIRDLYNKGYHISRINKETGIGYQIIKREL